MDRPWTIEANNEAVDRQGELKRLGETIRASPPHPKKKTSINLEIGYVLLLLFLVACQKTLGEFVEVLAVIQLDFGPPPEEILQLADDGDLRLHPHVQTSQLLVQLAPNICQIHTHTQKKKRDIEFNQRSISRRAQYAKSSSRVRHWNRSSAGGQRSMNFGNEWNTQTSREPNWKRHWVMSWRGHSSIHLHSPKS